MYIYIYIYIYLAKLSTMLRALWWHEFFSARWPEPGKDETSVCGYLYITCHFFYINIHIYKHM